MQVQFLLQNAKIIARKGSKIECSYFCSSKNSKFIEKELFILKKMIDGYNLAKLNVRTEKIEKFKKTFFFSSR
jgi:hypothetical protein